MNATLTISETKITLSELLDLVEKQGEAISIMRSGKVVANVSPNPGKARTGAELAERMKSWPRLLPGDAEDFARTIEEARNSITMPDDPWA